MELIIALQTILILIFYCEDGKTLDLARNVPLCIRYDDPNLAKAPPVYQQFEHIIRNANKYFSKNSLKLRPPGGRDIILPNASDHQIFHWIAFSKIKLNLVKAKNNEFVIPTKPLGDNNEFNQRLHIQIKAQMPIAGLIVQAIHGPIGIPFGSFADFKGAKSERCVCLDCNKAVKNFVPFPCTYKPRAALTHPDVFTWHSEHAWRNPESKGPPELAEGKFDEIHFNFNFIDVKCHRASTVRFLVLAVADFGDRDGNGIVAEAALTGTFSHQRPFSVDGIPYPFHPDFCTALLCGEGERSAGVQIEPDFVVADFANAIYIHNGSLRYSPEYDMCTQLGPVNANVDKTCGPGPFRCSNDSVIDNLLTEAIHYKNLSSDSKCICDSNLNQAHAQPTPFPLHNNTWFDESLFEDIDTDTTIRTTPSLENITVSNRKAISLELRLSIEELESFVRAGKFAKAFHGILMFLAFNIGTSISIFLARFDKDMLPGVGCCGKGMWLWIHIVIAALTLTSMWSALIVLVVAEDSEWIFSTNSTYMLVVHIFFGVFAMLLFHIDFLFGWIRPIGRIRVCHIKSHAICGYVCKFLAVLAMIITDTINLFPLIIVITTELVSLAFYGFNTFVQCLIDSHMEMKSHRRICPYIEYKDLDAPVPASCGMLRNLILVIYILVLSGILSICATLWPNPMLRSYFDLWSPGIWEENNQSNAINKQDKG